MNENTKQKSAVVLLSGGLDSATTLAYAIDKKFYCHALSFVYGQKHNIEIKHAKKIAKFYKISKQHKIIKLDRRLFISSALTGRGKIPQNRDLTQISEDIPQTYVPARNTIFLSMALAYAEQIDAYDIFIGANAVDYSGYPDCRPEFIHAFEKLANLATKAGVEGKKIKIHAPLIHLSKSDIIKLGLQLGLDYSLTWSCYNPQPNEIACGKCDSCIIRQNAFEKAGIKDPIKYSD